MTSASQRWAEELARWAIPDELLAQSDESPYELNVAQFVRRAETARVHDSPSRRRASEVLAEGGTVLDVGCGAGAASLALVPPAGKVIGVDENPSMLAAYAATAAATGVEHVEIQGRWPDVAAGAPTADVAVCHHVVYNVADLGPFVDRLTDHARRRVVLELSVRHPLAWTTPYWRALHHLDRPDGPTVDDAMAVLEERGLEIHVERWQQTTSWAQEPGDELVEHLRRRLCLPRERGDDLRRAIQVAPPPRRRDVATVWWDGTALAPGRRPASDRPVSTEPPDRHPARPART